LTPWADPDLCRLLVRRPWWRGFGHQDDFGQFIVFVYDGDDNHIIFFFFDDFFFSGDFFSSPFPR
jgi:hypothetical protein